MLNFFDEFFDDDDEKYFYDCIFLPEDSNDILLAHLMNKHLMSRKKEKENSFKRIRTFIDKLNNISNEQKCEQNKEEVKETKQCCCKKEEEEKCKFAPENHNCSEVKNNECEKTFALNSDEQEIINKLNQLKKIIFDDSPCSYEEVVKDDSILTNFNNTINESIKEFVFNKINEQEELKKYIEDNNINVSVSSSVSFTKQEENKQPIKEEESVKEEVKEPIKDNMELTQDLFNLIPKNFNIIFTDSFGIPYMTNGKSTIDILHIIGKKKPNQSINKQV